MPMCDWSSDVCSSDLAATATRATFLKCYSNHITPWLRHLQCTSRTQSRPAACYHCLPRLDVCYLFILLFHSSLCSSLGAHRRQLTRLPRPWDSPGKNTGVGCHFLLQRMKVKSESEVAQSCLTLSDSMDCSLTGSSVHGIFQARVLEWVPWPCIAAGGLESTSPLPPGLQ